jgi:hypothetical protein
MTLKPSSLCIHRNALAKLAKLQAHNAATAPDAGGGGVGASALGSGLRAKPRLVVRIDAPQQPQQQTDPRSPALIPECDSVPQSPTRGAARRGFGAGGGGTGATAERGGAFTRQAVASKAINSRLQVRAIGHAF